MKKFLNRLEHVFLVCCLFFGTKMLGVMLGTLGMVLMYFSWGWFGLSIFLTVCAMLIIALAIGHASAGQLAQKLAEEMKPVLIEQTNNLLSQQYRAAGYFQPFDRGVTEKERASLAPRIARQAKHAWWLN